MGGAVGNENMNRWATLDGNGTLSTHYTWGNRVDQQLGRIDNIANAYTTRWTLQDRLQSIRDLINISGTRA